MTTKDETNAKPLARPNFPIVIKRNPVVIGGQKEVVERNKGER